MTTTTQTSRRSFLKSGALVAAPAAAVAFPAVALAGDGSKAALARLQDERAIEALNRDFLRAFNRSGAGGTARLFAGGKPPQLAKGISRLQMDLAEEPKSFALAEDGTSATASLDCSVDVADELEGQETIVQMARMQGNAAAVASARKTLSARYVRQGDGWLISSLELT